MKGKEKGVELKIYKLGQISPTKNILNSNIPIRLKIYINSALNKKC
jgi:hypothetical protein